MKHAQVKTLPIGKREGIAGRHVVSCGAPAIKPRDALVSGNGDLLLSSTGDPANDHMVLRLRGLQMPQWDEPPKAPAIADRLAEIRNLILEGKAVEAAKLSTKAAKAAGVPDTLASNPEHQALDLIVRQETGSVEDYLFTLDLRTSLVTTRWTNGGGTYKREFFASRADGLVVLRATAPAGKLNITLKGDLTPPVIPEVRVLGCNFVPGGVDTFYTGTAVPPVTTIRHSCEGITLSGICGHGKGVFSTAVRATVSGGSIRADSDGIHVKDADSALFLIAARRDPDGRSPGDESALLEELRSKGTDFGALLERHSAIHRPMFDRLSIDLGGDAADYLLTGAELKRKQLLSQTIVPAYVEMIVDRGRFFLLSESGEFPPIYGHVNVNINHQISGGNIGALPEMMESFFRWIEGQLADARDNARRIFGARGFFLATHPDEESGRLYHYNEYFPHHYWISSSGWCLQPFLEHYQCSGDRNFLANRMIPLYKELFLFYEDFLSLRDEAGKRIFVPSYSPENYPGNVPCMSVINAAMDISVCREVLETLLTYAPVAGAATPEEMEKWRTMLDELPPHMVDAHGELKEWARADLEEHYDHRHSSHLYGAYPGHEFQPELDPRLCEAARIANRMRAFGNESFHGIGHRAQAAARLKDAWLLEQMLRLTLECGYVCDNFATVHNPYFEEYMPDAQGALPTIVMESLFYSRPGFVEPLPALARASFPKGSIRGMRARCFATVDELAWDLGQGTIALGITSAIDQEITACCRLAFGDFTCVEAVSRPGEGPAYRLVELKAGKTARLQWTGVS